ncbi:unnamed protein product [Urochloa humidicola]
MNPMVRSIVQRAVAGCSRRRITTHIQPDVRTQLSALRDARQVCSKDDGIMSSEVSIVLGVFLGLLYHQFKAPPKTADEIWMEIISSKGSSQENMG